MRALPCLISEELEEKSTKLLKRQFTEHLECSRAQDGESKAEHKLLRVEVKKALRCAARGGGVAAWLAAVDGGVQAASSGSVRATAWREWVR